MSRDDHLTKELVRAVLEGRLAPEAAFRRLASHVASLCPQCAEAVAEMLAAGVGEPTLSAVEEQVVRAVRRAEAAYAIAEEFVDQLHELARHQREPALRMAFDAHGPALVLLLVAAGRPHLGDDPKEALHWTELALIAARVAGLERDEFGVFAAAHVANARRAAGDLAGARTIFENDVFSTDLDQSLEDPAVAAEVWSLYGSLLIDLRHLEEALAALIRAAALADQVGDDARQGRALMQMAMAYHYRGDARAAVQAGRQALRCLRHGESMTQMAQFNLIHYLLDAGDVLEAHHRLAENRADFPVAWHTRTTWLEARLAAAEGDVERAELAYREVEREYRQASRPLDVAMVCLDLSTLYLSCGREDEIPPLMETVLQTFASDPHPVPAHVVTAFEHLRQAAAVRTLKVATLARLSHHLHDLRTRPRGPEQAPS